MNVEYDYTEQEVILTVRIPWSQVHSIECKGSLEDDEEYEIFEAIQSAYEDVDIQWDEDTGEAKRVVARV